MMYHDFAGREIEDLEMEAMRRDTQEQEVIDVVTDYVYKRHADLNVANVVGFDEDELARVKTEDSYLVFTVEDVKITEKLPEDNITIWYVAATLFFQVESGEPIEGSTDIYQCYRCWDSLRKEQAWCIEWYSS
jgi:hypothetical protein